MLGDDVRVRKLMRQSRDLAPWTAPAIQEETVTLMRHFLSQ